MIASLSTAEFKIVLNPILSMQNQTGFSLKIIMTSLIVALII